MLSSRRAYLLLCLLGILLPYSQFVPWLISHGLDMRLFIRELFANGISGFFAMDVIVSTAVLWSFVAREGRRLGVRHLWAPLVASLTVGVSLGLPLFLHLRQERLERRDQ
jgi:Terpene cyclase DEP1